MGKQTAMIFCHCRHMTLYNIPNKLSGGLALAFFVAALAAKLPFGTVVEHAVTGLVVLVVGWWMRDMIGGGSAKLLAATSLWMGPTGTLAGFACATAIFTALSVPLVRLVRGKESNIPILPAALLAFALFLPNTPVWALFEVGVRALTD